jgi:predicted MPP superfamily phosphohydrolase
VSLVAVLARIAARYRQRVGFGRRRSAADVSAIDLQIADLPSVFENYRIVILSDFHHPAGGDLEWLRHAVDVTNAAGPDLIALLGDYGESFKRSRSLSQAWYRDALAEMTAHIKCLVATDGLVAVLGNHDYYADAGAVERWLSHVGADVLVNRARMIVRREHVLRIAGLDDVFEGRPEPTVGCAITGRQPTIVLSHNPDGLLHLHPNLRVDALIAGHTHGGQIVVPGYGAPLTMAKVCRRRSASGWVPNPRARLYVTRGLGEQLPLPIRFNCRRELVVVRLTAGA